MFSWRPVQEPGLYDEVEVELPEGAKMVKNGFDQDVVELANGCICPDLLTMHRRGIAYPYIVDTTGDKHSNIFFKKNSLFSFFYSQNITSFNYIVNKTNQNR